MRDPIDAVIAWVDGNDPVHAAKRERFGGPAVRVRPDVGGDTRFVSSGEIYFCLASILRFAPFVRRIHIVTDGQDPQAEDFVRQHFPGTQTRVQVVDHRTLYRGYEDLLPVFNSLSIETMLWRIPDLAEQFVYFNDDVFLTAPMRPEDWFEDGRAVCYAAGRLPSGLARLLRAVKPRRGGVRPFGHKDGMLNAADRLGARSFYHLTHTPFALLRSPLERYFAERPEVLRANAQPRFRDPSQFNPQELGYLLAAREGRCLLRPGKGRCLFLKPAPDKPGYVARKLREAARMPQLRFGCINSMEQASPQEQRLFLDWIGSLTGVRF